MLAEGLRRKQTTSQEGLFLPGFQENGGRMEKLERFFYESKPFICLALAVYAFAAQEPNRIALLSGLALLIAGTFILRGRFKRRRGSALEMLRAVAALLRNRHSAMAISESS
jgi:hypothetical protein